MVTFKQKVSLLASLIAAIWAVSIFGFVFDSFVRTFALVPREVWHLPGVIAMPFLHQGFGHLLANTIPLAVFGGLLLTRGADYFLRALFFVAVGSGLLLWLFGRHAAHIGASGVVFGLFGLLIARAVFTKSFESLVIGGGVMLGYGGLVWGVLPSDSSISWDGHLAGLVAGVATARFLNEPGPQPT